MKERSFYIITKPLQYINCTNIDDDQYKICAICDQFFESYSFFQIAKKNKKFNEYLYFKNKKRATLYALLHQYSFNKLFLDSDIGLLLRFKLLLFRKIEIYVYEEGVGSYVCGSDTNIRSSDTLKNKLAIAICNFLHIKEFTGGSCRTKGIYLYDHQTYLNNFSKYGCPEPKSFVNSFNKLVLESHELSETASSIDFDLYVDKSVIIYLTSWHLADEAFQIIKDSTNYDIKVLKLHPHIKEFISNSIFDISLPQNLMVEYFLFRILDISKSVHVIHHGSSALSYADFSTGKLTQTIIV